MRLGRIAMFIVTVWIYGLFALVQAEGQQLPSPPLAATVPRLIRITGSVHDATGRPLTGAIGITFTLYKDANDQVPVWQETQTVQLDSEGHYRVLLGATSAEGLPLEIFSTGEARWLGVHPDGLPEQPRILFLSVAYALKAADSEMLGGRPASAFVLAGSEVAGPQQAPGAQVDSAKLQIGSQVAASSPGGLPLLMPPPASCAAITSDGTATANQLSKFTSACNIQNSAIFESGGNVGIGNTNPGGMLDVAGPAVIRGTLSAEGGALITPTAAATATQGFPSNPLDFTASVFNATLSRPVGYVFRWQSEPSGNDSANTGATLHLLFGVTGSVSETGFSIAKNGVLTFAPGQTFPGLGTVTSVGTGAGLTGGPITSSGTISIPAGGVTNSLLANPSITVTAGSGLSGGGTVALGGTVTLTNTAPSSGGTVTSVATGAGLAGGPITKTGTISIPAGGVTNTMLATPSITVTAGSGLSGGGTVALGGTVTLTNAAPSSGGTVTSVASGAGLSGGPITSSGTLSLNTSFTDGRYLQLAGGALAGALTGTTAAFSGGLKASTATFTGAMTAAGGTMPNLGTATATQGFNSNPLDFLASSFSSTTSKAGIQDFRWQAQPAGNNSSTPSGTLNLLFGSNGGVPAQTGFSIASNGQLTFAPGQTFPGTGPGTVTSIATGAGLAGGPITKTGTISIPAGGVTNTMLASPSITVTAGSGLSGGGTVALGGTVTLTNAAPSSGGTVTSVAAGPGLAGGPIMTSGTLSLDTTFTDGRYLPLAGGTLKGALTGTTATFPNGLKSSTATLTGAVTAAGAVLPARGTATATQGFASSPLDLLASSFDSTTSTAISQDFRWQAQSVGNDSSSPSGILSLLFGSNGVVPKPTGFSVASNGQLTFAAGQTFPGVGTITQISAGTGLAGGGSSGNVSLSLLKTCSAGQTLLWNGTSWICGSFGSVSGTTGGMAYFASPASVTSTPAPTNGQILIGATGGAPVLGTLTAGPNITITNGPGSVAISAAGATALPFFATGGERTDSSVSAGNNVTVLWGFLLPYNVKTTNITYDVTTPDNTANNYDIGLFDSSGTLVLNIGATTGAAFAPAAAFQTLSWAQGSTNLAAGRYYLAFTTNCSASCAAIGAATNFVSFAVNASAGASVGGALPTNVTLPADTWSTGPQPTIVIH